MKFSLLYFSGDGSTIESDKYKLLLETAKFADNHDFSAVWTPERHFHPFGGLYPNPSVISAALAMVTEKIQLRSGSIVMPLQHPARVAEEWAIVDNLSHGRVGLSFAPGWHADDFLLRPENYAERKEVMWRDIETLQKLWHGEDIEFVGGTGNKVKIKTYPRPIQSQVPIWITCQSDNTFIGAAKIGANVLTSLLYATVDDLALQISLYRETLAQNGHNPKSGKVSLMMHTYMGDNEKLVKQKVKQPFCEYLKTHFGLVENLAQRINFQFNPENFTEEDRQQLLEFAFERYFQQGRVLIGTPETCGQTIARLQEIGVDEIACLVDFGLDFDVVMTSLDKLKDFKKVYQPQKEVSSYSAISLF
ncbi:natural product biosynthesis luciferase-like monooxygenase domain protein [Cylindrospermum stagnale PCC 7417]|uniref:Natural product biosynthesis luciferase-like monooxygenase domain protein n=1 Tax=Cylindrospermum stagnale PCC 7417 TaxID=56107 RepID=K9WVG2_9NOST|nr:LLM class flavin-dependent oxidoreductase [Cylindrospermum stagnale]AFZ23804.1 natural product biosynthesis luciferase-like monooxygenase domain protein [Cylindrospermum stagnale PCC 7417]